MLRQLVLANKIEALNKELREAETLRSQLAEKRDGMSKREAEIVLAINEVNEETSNEDRLMVETMADEWAKDEATLTEEETKNEELRANIQQKIEELTQELNAINERANKKPMEERKDVKQMMNRDFFGMSCEQRDALMGQDSVKNFVHTVRAAHTEKRSIANAGLLIPTEVLPIIREVTANSSKLMGYVNKKLVPGKSRQTIMGVIPEAYWTEMTDAVNKLELSFTGVELDGYKVGGYVAVCNSILEDTDDVGLMTEIINAIGQAIGKALDKAILFGAGGKMPKGIFPALDASHKKSITGKTGSALFAEIVKASALAHNEYSNGKQFWAMNYNTWASLKAEAIAFNANGALVAGMDAQMPVVGGDVVVLECLPANTIIGGFGDMYVLAEREGTSIASSEHAKFAEDVTVFRGTARYDGAPAVPSAFVAIGLGAAPNGTVTFASVSAE